MSEKKLSYINKKLVNSRAVNADFFVLWHKKRKISFWLWRDYMLHVPCPIGYYANVVWLRVYISNFNSIGDRVPWRTHTFLFDNLLEGLKHKDVLFSTIGILSSISTYFITLFYNLNEKIYFYIYMTHLKEKNRWIFNFKVYDEFYFY